MESIYFKSDEFKCSCGCNMDIEDVVKRMIFEARAIAGVPFVITSGARCLDYNYKIGSRPTSSHIKGLAVDIAVQDNVNRARIVNALYKVGFRRFGHNFEKKFIHVDLDLEKPMPCIFGY